MDRREFGLGALSGLTSIYLSSSSQAALAAATASTPTKSAYGLLTKTDPTHLAAVYANTGRPGPDENVPYVYAFYDPKKGFVKPSGVTPNQGFSKSSSYSITPTLRSFNISTKKKSAYGKLQNQVQLALNATTYDNALGSDLSWLFLNAIDVFSSKSETIADFMKGNGPGGALTTTPPLKVNNGMVTLRIGLNGQRPDGIFAKLFNSFSTVLQSSNAAPVLTSFGVPSLATSALQFVDHALTTIFNQDHTVPLWQSASADFSVATDVPADYYLCDGRWIVVDSDYARAENFLAGHTLDVDYMSNRLLKNQLPVDVNYFVISLTIK